MKRGLKTMSEENMDVTRGELCEATYILSKSAKRARDNQYAAQEKNNHRQADAYTIKKGALYGLKARCLSFLYGDHNDCEIHIIGNSQYYYLSFETDTSPTHPNEWTWEFHVPTWETEFDASVNQNELSVSVLSDFSSETTASQSELTLQEAVKIVDAVPSITKEHVIDAQQQMMIDSIRGVELWK